MMHAKKIIKPNKTARHRALAPHTTLYIMEIVKEFPDERNSQFKCRYFSEGKFFTEIFYGFELELIEN